jgi:uncharacterized membrane protein YdjX (TVP38/TMEM64 family)
MMNTNIGDLTASDSKGLGKQLARFAVAITVFTLAYFAFGGIFSLDYLAAKETELEQLRNSHPILIMAFAFLIYVLATGLSLPGATLMTLVVAWYFGFWKGLVLVSFASTCGATLAFLLSRYLLRDIIQSKFGERLKTFNESLDREGAFYLFTLRLIPAVPFFVINVVMGLTRIRTTTFWWISQVGMLAGTCVYVYAGSNIPSLSQLVDPSQLRAAEIRDWPGFVVQLQGLSDSDGRSNAMNRSIDKRLTTQERRLLRTYPPPSGAARALVGKSHLAPSEDPANPSEQVLQVNRDQQMEIQLAQVLNRLLHDPNLVPNEIQSVLRAESQADLQHLIRDRPDTKAAMEPKELKKWEKHVTRINREAMIAVYPRHIRPPRGILNWQLIVAFVALGVFPLAVKKIMARPRPA